MMRESTKQCRRCGSTTLRLFSSLRLKVCDDCLLEMPWDLEPDQQPLVGPSRPIRKAGDAR